MSCGHVISDTRLLKVQLAISYKLTCCVVYSVTRQPGEGGYTIPSGVVHEP